MAQWQRLFNEFGSDIAQHYNESFPVEVRQFLSEWIERQNLQNEQQNPHQFLRRMINKLNMETEKMVDNDMLYMKVRLSDAASNFSQNYSANPEAFLQLVQNVLNAEVQLLKSVENQITQTIQNLLLQTQGNEEQILELIRQYEEMIQTNVSNTANVVHFALQLFNNINGTVNNIELIQSNIINKYLSLCHGNSVYDLDIMQNWCENLAFMELGIKEKLLKATEYIRLFGNEVLLENATSIRGRLELLLTTLFKNSLVIVNQPPRIIKTDTIIRSNVNDSMLIRFLIVKMVTNTIGVKVSILSESQVDNVKLGREYGESRGNFHPNPVAMSSANNQLTASFNRVKLLQIRHTERRGPQETVTDDKFALIFKTSFAVDHQNFQCNVSVLSRPVVVIVNVSQRFPAEATSFWHNSFCDGIGSAFHTPDSVPWNRLASMLSNAFENSIGRGLTLQNLNSLAAKLSVNQTTNLNVSWSQFCKLKIYGNAPEQFTFWEWFLNYMELTGEHLKGLWNDGSVIGFIQKEVVENILTNHPAGTFLLRFSDSTKGGLSIARKLRNGTVKHVTPLEITTFSNRPLANQIMEKVDLICLYPNIPKEEAFRPYVRENPTRVGYVPFGDGDGNAREEQPQNNPGEDMNVEFRDFNQILPQLDLDYELRLDDNGLLNL